MVKKILGAIGVGGSGPNEKWVHVIGGDTRTRGVNKEMDMDSGITLTLRIYGFFF